MINLCQQQLRFCRISLNGELRQRFFLRRLVGTRRVPWTNAKGG